jgi:pantoate--beta-alanine ligase
MLENFQSQSEFSDAARPSTADVVPRLITRGAELRQFVVRMQESGETVGLVPTMGALHEGHLSLVDASRAECDQTVVTIFVNPTQFGPTEDYQHYPRDLDADLAVLQARGCDVVFAPTVEEMYPEGHETTIDVGSVAEPLEGALRPTHFRGVATVVMKLFQFAPADRAYFGQKDYQQTLVIKKMVRDLSVPIEIRIQPTIREPDGLAMSSRNAYLSQPQRQQALALSRSLRLAVELADQGEKDVTAIRRRMEQFIRDAGGVEVQYIAFVAEGTVQPVTQITGPTVAAIAAKVGRTRLIDNEILNPKH